MSDKEYIYYKTLAKRCYFKKIINKLEESLLDKILDNISNNISNNTSNIQSGGQNKYQVIYDKIRDEKDTLQTLEETYNKMKAFQNKLDQMIQILKPATDQSRDFEAQIQPIITMRDKYNKIINDLETKIQNLFYNPVPNQKLDLNNETFLFIKSDRNKWENLIAIYMHFIGNYKTTVNQIRNKDFSETIEIVNANIDENIRQYNDFMNSLPEFKNQLQNKINDLYEMIDIKYDKTDIKYTNNVTNIQMIEDRNKFIKTINFTEISELIKPGNITIYENIYLNLINNLKPVIDIDLNLELPPINSNRIKIQKIESNIPYQLGGTNYDENLINNTIDKLNQFALELQNTNSIMGEIRVLNESYIQLKIRINNFILYIMLIESNINKSTMSYYKYVNKLIVKYYWDILNEINRRSAIGDYDKYIEYFDIYHYVTIQQQLKFYQFLLTNMDDSIISIDDSTGNVRNSFVIFNNFKNILDQYVKRAVFD